MLYKSGKLILKNLFWAFWENNLRLRIMAQNIEGAISPLDAFLERQKPIYPPKRWIQMPCSLSLPQQIEQSVIKEKLLFAGFRKISSEVQKKFLHRTPVYGV